MKADVCEPLRAAIFNIQKFSIHDGPGIRTAVFFKGCPLRCAWCSNPESQLQTAQLLWDEEKCRRCRRCESLCPTGSLSFADGRLSFAAETCQACRSCAAQCPGRALELAGRKMTVEQVMEEVMKDIDFYEESGGGVTLSGGEVLAQPHFAQALLQECRSRSIHTALETTGYASREVFQSTAKLADLLLFDIKHHQEEAHLAWTGVSQKPILNNLDFAVSSGIPVVVRIPVIPGVNDSLEDAAAFSSLLGEHRAKVTELLPFHQFGQKKYEKLQRPYRFPDAKALHPEDLDEYAQILRSAGFEVRV